MTPNTPHHDQKHIDAVLEPVAPGSGYDFVEIQSDPIPFTMPWARLGKFSSNTITLIRSGIRTQWKWAAIFLVLIIIAEGTARTLEPRFMNRIYSRTQTGGNPLAMNEQGFRGDTVAAIKPTNTTRILALGDSVAFGSGIAWQDAWPNQLEILLNENKSDQHADRQTEVMNAALPALDLGQIELEYSTRWQQLQPDRAVIMVTGNMISFAYARRDRESVEVRNPKERQRTPDHPKTSPKDQALEIYNSFALPGVMTIGMEHLKFALGLERHDVNPAFPTGVMLAHGYTQNDLEDDHIEHAWSLFELQLEILIDTLAADEIPVTIVYSPPRFVMSDQRSDNLKWVNEGRFTVEPAARLSKICADLNVEFINPLEALRSAPSPVYMLSDYTHFDFNGQLAIAKEIANLLSE